MGRNIKVIAGPAQPVSIVPIAPLGDHVSLPLSDSAVTDITPPPDSATRYLLCQATVQDIRYTIGTYSAPSATSGFHMAADDPPVLIPWTSTVELRFIAETAGAVLEYQWCE